MNNRTTPTMTLPDFERLLDVYGADRTRWPLTARASAAARLAADAGARKLLAEAEALDAVLLHTAEPDKTDVAALAERIVAAARTAPRVAASDRVASAPVALPRQHRMTVAPGRDAVRGVALLAASLLIGVFVGQSQLGARAVPALEELTGIASPASVDRLAMLDLHMEGVDED